MSRDKDQEETRRLEEEGKKKATSEEDQEEQWTPLRLEDMEADMEMDEAAILASVYYFFLYYDYQDDENLEVWDGVDL